MNCASASAPIITAIVSLVVSLITAAATLRVARRRATLDADLANRRAAVDQRLTQLKAEIDQGLAEQRARLEQESLRFTRVHEVRAQIISRLYAKLVHAYNTAYFPSVLLNADRPVGPEAIDAVLKACSDAIETFDENRLFLPKRLEDEIDEIALAIKTPAYIYFGSVPKDLDEMRAWIKTFHASDIEHRLQNLALEFRELLGVKS